ncbi:MAG: Ig-like domain-containing protein, partial [Muribaculaceae bacterium]|nr:Ig-like domain-containing protein [Muribaculaceae bacterium]
MNKYLLSIISVFLIVSCAKKEIFDLQISKSELTMYFTEQIQLKASVSYSVMSSVDMLWSSDNPDVVTVDDFGNVTALSSGNAIVTLTCNDKSVECKINVIAEEFALFMSKSHSAYRTMWIWKNGEFIFNTASDFDVIPRDLAIYKTNIYACGGVYTNSDTIKFMRAAFWKDNIMNILPSEELQAEARAIAVNNDTTYIVGNIFSTDNIAAGGPAIWINGNFQKLSDNPGDVVSDISLVDGNYYIACGYTDNGAVYWTKDSQVQLPGNSGMAKFVETCDDNIYFIGETSDAEGNRNTAIWNNDNVNCPISNIDNSPTATFMFRNKLYIVGVIYDENGLYATTYLYSDGDIQYYSFDDAIYYPTAVSVTSQNIIIAFEKMEYTVEG